VVGLAVTWLVACSAPLSTQPQSVAPLTVADCGWPNDTSIAFEGWRTEAEMGMAVSSPTRERLYWLVTADQVELTTSRGSGFSRVACAVGREGLLSWRVVPDEWSPP
jgi:hypothetical protein